MGGVCLDYLGGGAVSRRIQGLLAGAAVGIIIDAALNFTSARGAIIAVIGV